MLYEVHETSTSEIKRFPAFLCCLDLYKMKYVKQNAESNQ